MTGILDEKVNSHSLLRMGKKKTTSLNFLINFYTQGLVIFLYEITIKLLVLRY